MSEADAGGCDVGPDPVDDCDGCGDTNRVADFWTVTWEYPDGVAGEHVTSKFTEVLCEGCADKVGEVLGLPVEKRDDAPEPVCGGDGRGDE